MAWSPAERIICSDADVILSQMLASQLAFNEPPEGIKDDLEKAYHQIGRRGKRVRVIQLFWHPEEREVWGREQFAQDFGPARAVTACNVIFRCLRDIANRWLYVNLGNYVDDYWSWEAPWSVSSARHAVARLFKCWASS